MVAARAAKLAQGPTGAYAALKQALRGAFDQPLEAQLADGTARAQGDLSILTRLAQLMVDFDPRFEILPGTRPTARTPATQSFQALTGATIPE